MDSISRTALRVTDLFGADELELAIDQRYVRRQHHPTLPLMILNYTESAQYDNAWNAVTLQCRGLIIDREGVVIARPWPKFFNYGDAHSGVLDFFAPAEVVDKMDGSLGILYPTGDGYAIATRGSFTSTQALHATKIWREKYSDLEPPAGMTLLFEIVYPSNRIVVNYGDLDDLVLLGAVVIATGRAISPTEMPGWPGPRAEVFSAARLADALVMVPRPNAEGVVVRNLASGQMVKLKQEDYLRMHRIVTQTSKRTVWEFLAVDACKHLIAKPKHWGSRLGMDPARAQALVNIGSNWLTHILDGIPDEFHAWINNTVDGLVTQAVELNNSIILDLADLRCRYGGERHVLAEHINEHPNYGGLWLMYDGKDITTYVWRKIFPEADTPWVTRSADAA